ncbi:MAG: hypothetical protein HQL34_12985 [Alphaproteobacteria bacterium]|nr:hypothetical protein [Alphaproteobacteria bacterium]
MKGSRTILFNLVMAVAAMAGIKIAPDTVTIWLDVFVSVWAIGAMLLRQVTNTPVFQKEAAGSASAADIARAVSEALVQGLEQPSQGGPHA